MSGGVAPIGSGSLVRAQELRAAEERVEREEAKGRVTREAWGARMHDREIKERELRLLQEQVGSSNATRVRRCSILVSIFLCLKGLPPRFRSTRK